MLVILIFLALISAVVLLARNQTVSSDKLTVSTTFYPLYDFSRQIGGNFVAVGNITPAGAEPHDFEPSPGQLVTAGRSRILVYNGSRFEPWIPNFLQDYRQLAVAAGPAGQSDPHFWLDPVLARQAVDKINRAFQEADPVHAAAYQRQANDYSQRLRQLDTDYQTGLRDCTGRTIVTAHGAFGFLAKRYNLEVITIAGLSPDAEPSAAKLAEVVDTVRRENISTIFFESLTSPQLSETIARESGARTAVLDPIEGLPASEQTKGKDYISVQRQNLAQLRTALVCR